MRSTVASFLGLLILTLNNGCLDLSECPEEVTGKYVCNNDPNATNYLELNKDGSFLHYYRIGDKIITDTGNWNRSENGYCEIEFSNWKTFNESGLDFEKYARGILFVKGKSLDITPDGESSASFTKDDSTN
jgi:hypothetical protein